MPLMTKSEYAAYLGVSRAFISKKSTKEKLVSAEVVSDLGKTLIDSDLADKIFKITEDPARAPFRKRKDTKTEVVDIPDAGFSDEEDTGLLRGYEKSRAEREAIKVEHSKLDLLQRKGETVLRQDVVRAVSNAGAAIREHLQARNRRLAEQASTMRDAREIKAMLDADDRAMLEMISDDFLRRVSDSGSGGQPPTIN